MSPGPPGHSFRRHRRRFREAERASSSLPISARLFAAWHRCPTEDDRPALTGLLGLSSSSRRVTPRRSGRPSSPVTRSNTPPAVQVERTTRARTPWTGFAATPLTRFDRLRPRNQRVSRSVTVALIQKREYQSPLGRTSGLPAKHRVSRYSDEPPSSTDEPRLRGIRLYGCGTVAG